MKDFDIEERVNRAVRNFEAGYNCAQSVFLAYSDVFELEMETAKKMSVSFGGGVGRMREICGTVSAMDMLAGFKYPVQDISDQEARTKNYAMVQKNAERRIGLMAYAINLICVTIPKLRISLNKFV